VDYEKELINNFKRKSTLRETRIFIVGRKRERTKRLRKSFFEAEREGGEEGLLKGMKTKRKIS